MIRQSLTWATGRPIEDFLNEHAIFGCAGRSRSRFDFQRCASSFGPFLPRAGNTVTKPPAQVTIKYDAPIEKLFASLQVVSAMGQNQVTGKPEVSADGRKLSVPVNKLPPGEYTVQWRVVCIDSHHTQGSYSFIVAGPPL
jgi:copper resistance protein C